MMPEPEPESPVHNQKVVKQAMLTLKKQYIPAQRPVKTFLRIINEVPKNLESDSIVKTPAAPEDDDADLAKELQEDFRTSKLRHQVSEMTLNDVGLPPFELSSAYNDYDSESENEINPPNYEQKQD